MKNIILQTSTTGRTALMSIDDEQWKKTRTSIRRAEGKDRVTTDPELTAEGGGIGEGFVQNGCAITPCVRVAFIYSAHGLVSLALQGEYPN